MKFRVLLVTAATAALALVTLPGATAGAPVEPRKNYVVQFADGTSQLVGNAKVKAVGGTVARTFKYAFNGAAFSATASQAGKLAADPSVVALEEEQVYTASDVPGQWGQDRIDQAALPLSGSYTYASNGTGVTVYVVDTGIRYTHVELAGRVLPGANFVSDGQTTAADCHGHGTHVSGIVGGLTYGVAKNVTYVPVRVLDCAGSGSTSGVAAGLDYVASQITPNALAVVNMSLGGGKSSIIDNAVNRVINAGATVVVAAGNSTADACRYSPAAVPAAITVAASDVFDKLASYSNYGSCVDIIAPGSDIRSSTNTSDTSYANWSGTSMATPQVVGVVARLLQSGGYKTPSAMSTLIKSMATKNKVTLTRSGGKTPNNLLYMSPTS